MKHLGILATTPEGAALCFQAYCQNGFAELGPHDHPDVTLDCIALARNLPAWRAGDYAAVRATPSVSARRLAAAGTDFYHLIAVHTWGWTITLNPDGTTTMTSPGKTRIFPSHSPPAATAA